MRGEPRLIAITDTGRATPERWLAVLEPLLAGAAPGRVLVLLRDPALPVRQRQRFGEALRARTAAHGQLLAVGDRLDLAALLEADAVHLPRASVTVTDARRFGAAVGRDWRVSRACHAAPEAAAVDADAALLSPVLAPRKGRAPLGLAGITRARELLGAAGAGRPRLYALGGIDAESAAACLASGADGVAAIGALLEPDAPRRWIASLAIAR